MRVLVAGATGAPTNALRTRGTDSLLAAASAAGVRRFIAQSYAGYYARAGGRGLS
jgi:nucleoside-diphosphate-sugar epimerase